MIEGSPEPDEVDADTILLKGQEVVSRMAAPRRHRMNRDGLMYEVGEDDPF